MAPTSCCNGQSPALLGTGVLQGSSLRCNGRRWAPHSPQLPCLNRKVPSLRRKSRYSLSSGLACRASLDIAPQTLLLLASRPTPGLLVGAIINSTVFILGIKVLLKGLTGEGVAHSWLLGTLIYSAFGWGGYALVCLYFIFGSAVTKIKLAQKQKEGIAEARSGRRSPGSVWGSGIAGTACAAAVFLTGTVSPWQVGFVASFVSKLSDTVSSEIGKAYGKTTYLATTLEKVPRGTEGAVSLEGTLAGVGAAFGFAFLAILLGQVNLAGAGVVAFAAVVANLFESYLGASIQSKVDWLTNDVVNMIQISVAAAVAILISLWLGL